MDDSVVTWLGFRTRPENSFLDKERDFQRCDILSIM